MIQVQNVTFFTEKNEILISRGVRKVWVCFNDKGEVMVKMKGFDRYFFDPDNGEVYSKVRRQCSLIKPQLNEVKKYFWLYKNGIRTKVYLWEILRDNMSGIELFIKDRKSLVMVS